jgi:hypothetical protein
MNDNFAVVLKSDRSIAAVFEGTRDQMTSWLKAQDDVSAYEIYSPVTQSYYSVVEAVKKPEPLFPDYFRQFIPKFYTMDPKTEDLLFSGRDLANGMVILVADSDSRQNLKRLDADWELDRAFENNRWAKVTNLQVLGNSLSFVAVYEDGSKRIRSCSVSYAWFVKLDSVPDVVLAEEKAAQKYNSVLELVKGAMMEQEQAMLQRRKGSLMPFAEKTARHIVGLI